MTTTMLNALAQDGSAVAARQATGRHRRDRISTSRPRWLLHGLALVAFAVAANAAMIAPAAASVMPGPVHGTRFTAVLAEGPRTALPSTRHSAFPGAVRLPDGRLLVVWREATSHLSSDGDIWGSTSADNGRTWTPQTTRLTMVGYDVRDPSLALIDGTLYMTFCVSRSAALGVGVYITRSTDGQTWTTPVRVDGGMPRAGESGPVLALPDGRLMQAFYGHPAGETRDSMWVAYSDDQGRTWTTQSRILNGQVDGRDYEEPWATTTSTGLVRVYLRWGASTQIGSIDFDGTNWSSAHALWAGSGRPACVPNGARVLCVYRQADPTGQYRPALMRLSTDGGRTFGPAGSFDSTGTMFTYAAPVAVGAGWVVPYAVQTGTVAASTSSQMYSRTVTVVQRGAATNTAALRQATPPG